MERLKDRPSGDASSERATEPGRSPVDGKPSSQSADCAHRSGAAQSLLTPPPPPPPPPPPQRRQTGAISSWGRSDLMAVIPTDLIAAKVARLRNGAEPRVLDLFSGCGGLSLGFQAAGFSIEAAVEFDAAAAASHGLNFHDGDEKHSVARDITTTSAEDLCRDLRLPDHAAAFDVIVGGPPCQAFARVGRSKLREVADHPEAFRHDPRARLYSEYLEYVRDCAPLAIVMENVPDMLNHAGHNLADEISEVLNDRDYDCSYTLLNAAFYGVPQMRERMFLVATHRALGARFSFPEPSHFITLPRGYDGSRSVAMKVVNDLFDRDGRSWYVPPPKAKPNLPAAVGAEEALSDLPKIFARGGLRDGTLKRGTRRLNDALPYTAKAKPDEYVRLMREWIGFEGADTLADHTVRYLPRDYKLFARLPEGAQYPDAFRIAETMFEEALDELDARGRRPQSQTAEWEALRAAIVPPYDPGKFPNKWRKLERRRPSRTLMAHLGKDSYSHIHYDAKQARTISVREAARLQSFPDGFRFCGTMNPAFRQIGNAVPPLMSKAIGGALRQAIDTALTQRDELQEAS